jgi:enoyl-CoA hydratase/carnithine racemase
MNYSDISVNTAAHTAKITIMREKSRNSLRGLTIQELTDAFQGLSNDASIRCINLRSEGTKAFCAGADLSELGDNPDPLARRTFFEAIAALLMTMQECPKPIISLVDGPALAGGMGLVAASDIVLATQDAVFGLPEVKIGLAPLVVMAPLSNLLTRRLLSRLVLTGEQITAEEAAQHGLVTETLPSEAIEERCLHYISVITSNAPEAVQNSKQTLHSLDKLSIEELADQSALRSLSVEAREGITAFKQKRKPIWK